jgi:CubicO group peptidase (beta-lactamase class C family)/D-alanyl-D-alanine dipeptidase
MRRRSRAAVPATRAITAAAGAIVAMLLALALLAADLRPQPLHAAQPPAAQPPVAQPAVAQPPTAPSSAAPSSAAPMSSPAAQPAAAQQSAVLAAKYAPVIERIERLIDHEMRDKGLPAVSIALVDDQDVIWAKGFGFADPAQKIAATADTVYRVGSVSKLFTDIAVMQLAERGVLNLDAPVTTYLPDFKPKNPFAVPITLRHLMSHRAGLVREPPVGHYFDPTSPSLAKTVASLNDTELIYAPGTRTKYSNAGVAVVGRVLEVMAKRPFAEALQASVIAALGLRRSAFAPTPAIMPHLAKASMWTYFGTQFEAPTFQLGIAPAGSMYSTVTDLARFMSVLFARGAGPNGPVLKPDTLEAMWLPQFAPAGARQGFGLGFNVGELQGQRRVGHNGAIYGFATDLQMFPDARLGIALVTTLDGANAVMDHIAEEAMAALLRVHDGRPLPPLMLPDPMTPEMAKKFDGQYQSGDRRLEMRDRNGTLIATVATIMTPLSTVGRDLLIDGRIAYGATMTPQADGSVTMGALAYRRAEDVKPPEAPEKWLGLVGEYGWDHNILYVLEREGKLYALVEWFFLYPLDEVGPDLFAFPKSGLYDGEKLRFSRGGHGQATAVDVGGVKFARRPVGLTSDTFHIKPLKPINALRTMAASAQPPAETGSDKHAPDLVELSSLDPSIKYDIRYATSNNFMGEAFYRHARALMQRPAAEAVARAARALKAKGFGLLIHDAYRPWAVTKMFWEATPPAQRVFVADPAQGSRHNRGCAVDLTLYDLATGKLVPMVGGYDEFSDRSYPNYPGGTSLQRWDREVLRKAMEAEGFTVYDAEWWHFDYKDWRAYPILNVPFEQLPVAKTAAMQ